MTEEYNEYMKKQNELYEFGETGKLLKYLKSVIENDEGFYMNLINLIRTEPQSEYYILGL